MPVVIILIITITSFAQDTKIVVRQAEKGGTEEFYVLQTDKRIKHGTYIRFFTPAGGYAIIESGSYSFGQKQGTWEYFYFKGLQRNSWNTLREKGTYVSDKKHGIWTTFYLDTVASESNFERNGVKKKTDSVSVSIEQKTARLKQAGMYLNDKRVGEWLTFDFNGNLVQRYNYTTRELLYDNSLIDSMTFNRDRKPIYIGGGIGLTEYLYYNFEFSRIPLPERDSAYAVVSFVIDSLGNVEAPKIDRSSGSKELEKELIRLVVSTAGNWVPGLKDGKKMPAHVYRIRKDIVVAKKGDESRQYKSYFTVVD
jgi:antitoxin component YwqK of YwqJK toxin-antitoxin module